MPTVTVEDFGVVMNVFVHRYVNRVWLGNGKWHGLLHRDSHCFDYRNRHGVGYLDGHRDWLWYRDSHRVRDSYRNGMRHLDADVLDDWHRYRLSNFHRLGNGHGMAVRHDSTAMFVGTIAIDNSTLFLVLVLKIVQVFGEG